MTALQGSLYWMAPEIMQTKQGYNAKIDIWSLGCVFLEMWAGRPPWEKALELEVMFKVRFFSQSDFFRELTSAWNSFQLVLQKKAPPVPSDVHLTPEADDFRRQCFA